MARCWCRSAGYGEIEFRDRIGLVSVLWDARRVDAIDSDEARRTRRRHRTQSRETSRAVAVAEMAGRMSAYSLR